jgi:hypothetical protein
MGPEALAWLDADLAAHADRALVVLNHEPFAADPRWPIDYEPALDHGRLAAHKVRYVLAGHVHWNGLVEQNGTTHITTGALSGLRWILPADLHERGYRLFYARDGRLWHAWKRLDEPALAFVGGSDEGPVFVAADRSGAFASVEATQDGVALPLERWGAYFVRVRAAPGSPVELVARDREGSELRTNAFTHSTPSSTSR